MSDKSSVSVWDVPQFANEELKGTNAMGYTAGESHPPTPEIEEKPEPLTAQALEEIRLAAYEEGLSEGLSEGKQKGEEEGRLKGLQDGYEAGLEQGKKEGLQQGQALIDEHAKQWQDLALTLQQPLRDLDKSVSEQIVNLVTDLCQQLLKVELVLNPKLILQLLNEAIEALPKQDSNLKIHLNPEDLLIISANYSDAEQEKRGWTLCAEPSLARGSCKVMSELSSVHNDLSIRMTQLCDDFILENSYQEPEVAFDQVIEKINPIEPISPELIPEVDLDNSSDNPPDVAGDVINEQVNDSDKVQSEKALDLNSGNEVKTVDGQVFDNADDDSSVEGDEKPETTADINRDDL